MLNRPPHWFVVAIIYHARNPRRNIDISKTLASCSEGGRFFSPKHARALPHIALKIQKPLLPGKPVRKLPLLDVPEHDICQESESSKVQCQFNADVVAGMNLSTGITLSSFDDNRTPVNSRNGLVPIRTKNLDFCKSAGSQSGQKVTKR